MQEIDWDRMDVNPETGFEERMEELREMGQDVANLRPEDFFPEEGET
jgi:hypothetical protein